MRIPFVIFGLVLFLAGTPILGTDLSGTWELQIAESDFGDLPAPQELTQVITQQGSVLTLEMRQVSSRGEWKATLTLRTDGSESANDVLGGTLKSKMRWEEGVLKGDHLLEMANLDVTMKDEWKLSEDGSTLQISRVLGSEMGEVQQRLVFEKK